MSDIINAAVLLATKAHRGQVRKYNGEPYILHPLRVMIEASKIKGVQPHHLAAAVCHDVLEDCPDYSYQSLVGNIGHAAARLVQGLTNTSKGSGEPRYVRKQMDREHLIAARQGILNHDEDGDWLFRLKMLDREDNLMSLEGCKDKDYMQLYAQESFDLWKVLKIADDRLSHRLRMAIATIECSVA